MFIAEYNPHIPGFTMIRQKHKVTLPFYNQNVMELMTVRSKIIHPL